MNQKRNFSVRIFLYAVLICVSAAFLAPVFIVLLNSFKGRFFISEEPFSFPDSQTFAGIENYINGLEKTEFISAFGWSVFITVFSVAAIVVFTSMTAWYIVRVKNAFTKALYFIFVFSMIVPFQMVMFTMTKTAGELGLDTPWGIVIIYLGFGAGLAVFMFTGFVKSIPISIEEAAMIDGCNPLSTFFRVVLPIMKPTYISVAILQTMWIWNDYLLPTLVLDKTKGYYTIPMAIQSAVTDSYGTVDYGAFMALLVLAIIPIVVFYALAQKQIIRGVISGAVKG